MQGEPTILEHKAMLEQKEEDVRKKIVRLKQTLDYIAWKKSLYDDFIFGRREYYTNLVED